MILKIPMTGTVIDYDPQLEAVDGIGITGDPNDPVTIVKIDFGVGFAWHLVSIDLENDLMEIEIEAASELDKQQLLTNAQAILSKPLDKIYAMTGDKRLVKPPSVMEKYRAVKSGT